MTIFSDRLIREVHSAARIFHLRVGSKSAAYLDKAVSLPLAQCDLTTIVGDHECYPFLHVSAKGKLANACHLEGHYRKWRSGKDQYYPVFKRVHDRHRPVLTEEQCYDFHLATCQVYTKMELDGQVDGHYDFEQDPQREVADGHRRAVDQARQFKNRSNVLAPQAEVTIHGRPSAHRLHFAKDMDVQQQSRISEYYDYLYFDLQALKSKVADWYGQVVWVADNNYIINHQAYRELQESDGLELLVYDAVKKCYKAFDDQQPLGHYDYAFNGKELVPLAYVAEKQPYVLESHYMALTQVPYILVSHKLKLVQQPRIMRMMESRYFMTHYAIVDLLDGCPGSGKSRTLVERVKFGHMVLTQGRESRAQLDLRLQSAGKGRTAARTIDSYKLNFQGFDYKAGTVHLDEALLVHPGEIDIIACLSEANQIHCYGDTRQISFLNRLEQYGFILHQTYYPFDSIQYLNVSYRCPKAVAKVLGNYYPDGMTTENRENGNHQWHQYEGPDQISTLRNSLLEIGSAQILCYTQREKRIISSWGIEPVNTIHEAQGRQYDSTIVVRLDTRPLELFEKLAHAVVALSRHKYQFHYITAERPSINNDQLYNFLQAIQQLRF